MNLVQEYYDLEIQTSKEITFQKHAQRLKRNTEGQTYYYMHFKEAKARQLQQ